MKTKKNQLSKISLLLLMLVFISKIAVSQTETTTKQNTPSSDTKNPEKNKKSTGFMAYGGVTFNQMSMVAPFESTTYPGWSLGLAYKRGRFFYWQIGARYNNATYEVNTTGIPASTNNLVTVTDIDIPINVGINLLSITEKFLGLRIYVGAVPAFLTSVGTSEYPQFTKANANSFNFYGQGGVGVDVLFLSIDAGYNWGTTDVFKDIPGKPGQAFVNLGFRF
jgi:hypothetical protein